MQDYGHTITNEILWGIAEIVRGQTIAETSKLLTTKSKRLRDEATAEFIRLNLQLEGIKIGIKEALSYARKEAPIPAGIINTLIRSINIVHNRELAPGYSLDTLNAIYCTIADSRTPKLREKNQLEELGWDIIPAEEVLSGITASVDWYNQQANKNTYPLIKIAILKAYLMRVAPFPKYNEVISNLVILKLLAEDNINLRGYANLGMAYTKNLWTYRRELAFAFNSGDLTNWLGFFIEEGAKLSAEVSTRVELLSKESKIESTTHRLKDIYLTPRQEKIVEFLQDYGKIQNKDFKALFPNISEDSVLRDLKTLTKLGIVEKRGKTKASRYILK